MTLVAPTNAAGPPAAPAGGRIRPKPTAGHPWIAGPIFDAVFFWGAPLVAVAFAVAAHSAAFLEAEVRVAAGSKTLLTAGLLVFINAHLVLALVRSHGNATVFRAHPIRFTIVPVALFASMMLSKVVAVCAVVLVVWWDVYHSAMQTFGLARIYDRKAGNPPDAARRLDLLLNLLIYAGPILAGATFLDHVRSFETFAEIGAGAFAAVPARAEGVRRFLTWGVLAIGVPFVGYYVVTMRRLADAGHAISRPKVWLLATTAVCSIVWWGFNPFGDAFLVMNFFHAWQYFAIVWISERRNLSHLLRVGDLPVLRTAAPLALMVGGAFAYGVWVVRDPSLVAFTVLNVVALMHFYYDGFIWSVRKGQVP